MATSCGYYGDHELHKQGYAVFIVNIKKNRDCGDFEFEKREGAREDLSNLQNVFQINLGFEWINNTRYWHDSLPAGRWDHRYKTGNESQQIDKKECCICCHIQALDHSQSKCFLLAISSHGRELTGRESEIIFSDGKSVPLTEIITSLSDEKCPSLKGKPRIIILQVCRSNFEDKEIVKRMQDCGVQVNVETNEQKDTHSGTTISSHDRDQQDDPIVDYTFQQAAIRNLPDNFILVYPAISGQRSQRSTKLGSWLMYGLQKMFKEHYQGKAKPIDFLHLLTLVSGYIAKEKETIVFKRNAETNECLKDEDGNNIIDMEQSGRKNAVISYHKLCEPLIFYPKTNEPTEKDAPKPSPFFETNPGKKTDNSNPNSFSLKADKKKPKKGRKAIPELLSEDK